jgi:hypothetical protein
MIDAVIPWVNSNDPTWIKKYLPYKNNKNNIMARYRPNSELLYLIKLIRKNMSFIDTIYIVTSGEKIPKDVMLDNKVVHIKHEDIAPDSCPLPTFSSTIIETFIHRINNLSEEFIIFNDDFFPIKKIPSTFYFPERDKINLYHDLPIDEIIFDGSKYSTRLVRTNIWLRSLFGDHKFLSLAHIPNVMNKRICQDFIMSNKKIIDLVSGSRFRSDTDVQIRLGISYSHHFFDKEKFRIIRVSDDEISHAPMYPGNLDIFKKNLNLTCKSKFISIQDNLTNDNDINSYRILINKYLNDTLNAS